MNSKLVIIRITFSLALLLLSGIFAFAQTNSLSLRFPTISNLSLEQNIEVDSSNLIRDPKRTAHANAYDFDLFYIKKIKSLHLLSVAIFKQDKFKEETIRGNETNYAANLTSSKGYGLGMGIGLGKNYSFKELSFMPFVLTSFVLNFDNQSSSSNTFFEASGENTGKHSLITNRPNFWNIDLETGFSIDYKLLK